MQLSNSLRHFHCFNSVVVGRKFYFFEERLVVIFHTFLLVLQPVSRPFPVISHIFYCIFAISRRGSRHTQFLTMFNRRRERASDLAVAIKVDNWSACFTFPPRQFAPKKKERSSSWKFIKLENVCFMTTLLRFIKINFYDF